MGEIEGVMAARVHPVSFRLTVTHAAPPDAIRQAVSELGYRAEPAGTDTAEPVVFQPRKQRLSSILSGFAVLGGWLVSLAGMGSVGQGLYLLAVLIGGFQTLRLGIRALGRRDFDMNALMTLGVSGALLIGEWAEAGAIAFLYSLSNWLEAASMERTRGALRGLLELAPRVATVRRGDAEIQLDVSELVIGDHLIVRPGEKIPIDGVVLSGVSTVNQAPITGESVPVDKAPGAEVFAGTLNGSGALEIRVTKLASDTTLAKIVHLVEEAQAQRASVQRFVDRFARIYTPVVLAVALGVGLVPPLFGAGWYEWIYRALTLIVLGCPCALVVSTPIALVSGIGNAARWGILVKGGTVLERAASVQAIAFDKTGTLTQGRPEVREVLPLGGRSVEEVLRLAAAVEARSEHPLAAAVLRRAGPPGSPQVGQEFEAIVGCGAQAMVDGRRLRVGSPRWIEALGIDLPVEVTAFQEQGRTVVVLADEQQAYGLIAISDPERPEARHILERLRSLGLGHVVMLSGDNARTAGAIARELGVDELRADLLPDDKLEALRELEAKHGRMAMVGDGINDAPALAASHLGVAMGAAGSDVALETADVALMGDALVRLPFLIQLSRQTMVIIRQNIAFSLAIKAIATIAVFPGWLTLWLAVLSDMGATLLVTLNGLRLLALRPED